jgi:hypothetical protein
VLLSDLFGQKQRSGEVEEVQYYGPACGTQRAPRERASQTLKERKRHEGFAIHGSLLAMRRQVTRLVRAGWCRKCNRHRKISRIMREELGLLRHRHLG